MESYFEKFRQETIGENLSYNTPLWFEKDDLC